jgi:hypothetical protein
MRGYKWWFSREVFRIMGELAYLSLRAGCCFLLLCLAGCISLDRHFAIQAETYMRTTGDPAVQCYIDQGGLDEDTRQDVTFQHEQFKETIRKAVGKKQ